VSCQLNIQLQRSIVMFAFVQRLRHRKDCNVMTNCHQLTKPFHYQLSIKKFCKHTTLNRRIIEHVTALLCINFMHIYNTALLSTKITRIKHYNLTQTCKFDLMLSVRSGDGWCIHLEAESSL